VRLEFVSGRGTIRVSAGWRIAAFGRAPSLALARLRVWYRVGVHLGSAPRAERAPCRGRTQITADLPPITADWPLGLAPRTEALLYSPKDFFLGNGLDQLLGARKRPSHGEISGDPRSFCV